MHTVINRYEVTRLCGFPLSILCKKSINYDYFNIYFDSLYSLHKVEWQSFDSHWHGKCKIMNNSENFTHHSTSILLENRKLWKIWSIYKIRNEIFWWTRRPQVRVLPPQPKKSKPYNRNDCKVLSFFSAYKNQSLVALFWLTNDWFVFIQKDTNVDFNIVTRCVNLQPYNSVSLHSCKL